jgi:hypothetical protein
MDYPQETIETLRNLVKAQTDQIARLQSLRDLDKQLIAALDGEIDEQREIIEIDRQLQKALHEIIALLKGEECSATEI